MKFYELPENMAEAAPAPAQQFFEVPQTAKPQQQPYQPSVAEKGLGYAGRAATQIASLAGGIPGQILNTGPGLLNLAAQTILPEKISKPIREFYGPEQATEAIKEISGIQVPTETSTRQAYREVGEELGIPKELSEVKPGTYEERFHKVLNTLYGIFAPGLGSGAKTLGQGLLLTAASEVGEEAGKYVGGKAGEYFGGEKGKESGKLLGQMIGSIGGTMMLEGAQRKIGEIKAARSTIKEVEDIAKSVGDEVRQKTQGQYFSAAELQKDLDEARDSINKLNDKNPGKSEALGSINSMQDQVNKSKKLKKIKEKGQKGAGEVIAEGERAIDIERAQREAPGIILNPEGKPVKAPATTELTHGKVAVQDIMDKMEENFEKAFRADTPPDVRDALLDVNSKLQRTVDKFMSKNADISGPYYTRQELWKAIYKANEVESFLGKESKIAKLASNPTVKAILFSNAPGFILAGLFGAKAFLPTAIIAAAGVGGGYAAQQYTRFNSLMKNSPKAAQIYQDLKRSIIRKNSSKFRKSVIALNNVMNHAERYNPELFEEKQPQSRIVVTD